MQKKILFFFLLFSTIVSSQITYEHFYYNGYISRIVLENSGEKYYLVNNGTHQIEFFNANHSVWKTVVLSVPTNTYNIGINHISETKIKTDNLIEISYTTYSSGNSGNIYQSKIINEEGTVLLSVDNCSSLLVNEQEGLATKIISKTTSESNVYSVPDLLLEHTSTDSETNRIKLENSGIKYYTFNSENGNVTLYNIDYSFWKSITLNKPEGYSFSGISFLSENQINDDNLIEVGYGYYINGQNSTSQSKIINENGITLLTVDNARNITLSNVDGLSNKLMAYTNSTNSGETKIFSCPSLTLEHTYEGSVERIKLEISGEKYYDTKKNAYYFDSTLPSQTIIYNNDHTPWKTISTPVQEYWTVTSVYVSETKFDSDNQLELAYSSYSNTLDGGHYESYIINEDGIVLLTLPYASYLNISELPYLQNKLIVFSTPNLFEQLPIASSVYKLEGATAGVEEFNILKVSISPNPASSYLEFKSQNSLIKKAVVYDFQGKIIQKLEGKNLKTIDIQKIKVGSYIILLTDENNNTSANKFIKK